MLINELSKRTGLSAHTIRFYEKAGLIKGEQKPEVTSNNYYHYDETTVERLELIRDAKSVGFSIREIGELIDAWYSNHLSKDEKLAVLDKKIELILLKEEEMREMRELLNEFKKDVENEFC